ncbi:lantibiotic dehydratase [Actinoplanes siamensis]|uniref:Lantibiotic dehydratase n=1 Tax=Actinoplanes siamensis TaxID=1223317 RepID=A0A919N6R8_9ACTN|nr:lantibiotic dehydratase [Actinoplanes siamensis]GIF05442.1 lantibiotic dehydratase [Actinoplanes siamensis]
MIVRTAGFPVEELCHLRCPEAHAAAERVLSAERELTDVLATRGWDAARIGRLRERLDRGLPVRGRAGDDTERAGLELAEAYRSARARLAAVAEAAQARARDHLAGFAADPRVREVFALTNPGLLRDLRRGLRGARLHHQVALYMQRLCAKNETTSFFGPINYGELETGTNRTGTNRTGPCGIEVCWPGPASLRARRAHLSTSVVDATVGATAFSEPVRAWLVLRRRSGLPSPAHPDTLAYRLLARADGRTALRVHAAALRTGLDEVAAAARELVGRGLVTHQFQPPGTVLDPLAFVVGRLAFAPAPGTRALIAALGELRGLRDGFSAADADGKASRQRAVTEVVARLTGEAPDTPAARAQFYGDRLALREECAGALRLAIGGAAAARLLADLAPALEFLARLGIRRRALARAALARRLGVRRTPLWRLAAALGEARLPDTELDRRLASAIDPAAREVDLSTVELRDLLPVAGSTGVAGSVDVMICAASLDAWRAGDYVPVLADVHDTALLTDWALQFHDDRERVRADLYTHVAAAWNGVPVVCVLAGRRTGIPPLEPPAPIAELGGLPGQPNPWRVDVDDLVVESDGERARLVCGSLGGEVQLYNGELDTLTQTAFGAVRLGAPRIRLGEHTPRLRYGRAVLQRRMWTVPASALASLTADGGADRTLLRGCRLWYEYGLPPAVFVKLPAERKPMFAAVDAPYLLGALARIAARRTGGATVTEVLPALDQLWLADPPGRRYTAELRCVFVRAAEAGDD